MKNSLFLFCLLFLFPAITPAQGWIKTFGGSARDESMAVAACTDGGFITAGFTNSDGYDNMYILKTDAAGDSVWANRFTESVFAEDIKRTTDGGYIVTGASAYSDPGQVYLMKLNAAGDSVWAKTYGHEYSDIGMSVQQTADGGYIIAAQSDTVYSGVISYIYLIKTDANGDSVWTKRYSSGPLWQIPYSIQQTTDGGYIVAGAEDQGTTYTGDANYYVMKTDAAGTVIWKKITGAGYSNGLASIQQTADGGYIACGVSDVIGASIVTSHAELIRMDMNGDTVWTKRFPDNIGFSAVKITPDGGFILAGARGSGGSGDLNDVYIVKTNAAGDTTWTRTYDILGHGDNATSIDFTNDGGYILSGNATGDSIGTQIFLLRVDGNGDTVSLSTGIPHYERSSAATVYPNPTNAGFTVQLPENSNYPVTFVLYNEAGKEVKRNSGISSPVFNVARNGLAAGIYVYKLYSFDGLIKSGKVIIR